MARDNHNDLMTVEGRDTFAGANARVNTGIQSRTHNNYHKVKEHWRTALISGVFVIAVTLGVVFGIRNRSIAEG